MTNVYIAQENNNNVYVIESKDDKCHRSSTRPDFSMPVNFDVEIESTWQTGVHNYPYGLELGSDVNNFYFFGVSGDGYPIVWLYINNEYQKPTLIDWMTNTAFKGDGKTTNRHKVEVRGDILKYYVNDKYIGTISNRLNMKNIVVGVSVCDRQKVAFDNLKIIER
ncbi:MAG: hypothetical protein AB1480_14250 [Nitrospirota bacterium]